MAVKMDKRGIRLPHVYLIMMMVMLLVVILSWIVPSGEFAKVQDPTTGRMVIDPANFQHVNTAKPITLMDFFLAIHTGIVQTADIIVNQLIVSAVIYMIEKTGAIAGGIHKIIDISKGKELSVVVILMAVFTIMGAIGFGEGGLPFIPLCMTVVMAVGYDRLAGVGTAMIGLAVGFASGLLNLFTTGISQMIVGLPLFSGLEFRAVALVVFYIVSVVYVAMYCKKIKKDPNKSIVAAEYLTQIASTEEREEVPFNAQHKIALVILVGLFVLTAYGATSKVWKWAFPQISAAYLIYAVFLTILFKKNPSDACQDFAFGASRLLPAALTIGIARSVMALMDQAKIIDTAIHSISSVLGGQSAFMSLLLIYCTVIIFNFFVISGSGKAVIMMPIMGPLGKILGINQQVMVLVYQYGDGFTNYVWPTSGALMAGLAMCGVEWGDWIKFCGKLFFILSVMAFGFIVIADMIKLGPF